MAIGYVIFNPLAGNGKCESDAKLLEMFLQDELKFFDMTRITNYSAFIGGMKKDDYLVIAGGDGTLNRFVNDTAGIQFEQEILYFPVGAGNDFAHNLGRTVPSEPFAITQYLKELPSVEVKGKIYRFINGVGIGIDGYCCQVREELKKSRGKRINYSAIAFKGLLFHFDARDAKVTVDGKQFTYKKVWLAPTMHDRFYESCMMTGSDQNWLDEKGKLSLMVFHGVGRLRTLCTFPSIFKGGHIKRTEHLCVHTGHEITVEFDRPTPLQIDGETILGVSGYTARSAQCVARKRRELISV